MSVYVGLLVNHGLTLILGVSRPGALFVRAVPGYYHIAVDGLEILAIEPRVWSLEASRALN